MPALHNGNDATWLNMTCPICGKKFHLKPYAANKGKTHYCSVACRAIAQKEYCVGEGNSQYGKTGERSSKWNGGRRRWCGYWMVQCPGHPFGRGPNEYVFEHRIVAEQYLLTEDNSVLIDGKRYLSPRFVVHHKNEVTDDNRPENLQVMTKSEHQRLHGQIQARQRERNELGQYV